MNAFSHKPIGGNSPSKKPSFKRQDIPKPSAKQKKVHASLFRRMLRVIPKNKQEYQEKKVPFFFFLLIAILAVSIIGKVTWTSYQYLTHFEVNDILSFFSTDLKQDDKQRTNILLLGTGGEDHDGANLTDTIIIASITPEGDNVSLFSIPRDLWLDLPGYGSSRINKIYDILQESHGSESALEILKTGVEQITNVEIPYYIKIDFEGFKEVIDTLGGIEVMVEKSIYDTQYPDEDQIGYETFSIDAGLQILDGNTALKYARSRHSTSDFDRAERQQKILNAIKNKAQDTDFLSSPLLLKQLYEDFSDHVETNLSISELISLARYAKDFEQDNLTTAVLKNIDIIDQGSFLYTPERELFGGAFVLIPLGNSYEDIQRFINIVFDYPQFLQEKATIQILNGTRRNALASRLGQQLIPYGFNIERYANADRVNYTTSHYYIHRPQNTRVTEEVIKQFFPEAIKITGPVPEGIDTDFDISIIAGEDMDLSNF